MSSSVSSASRYEYDPSTAAAAVVAVLFAIGLLVTIGQIIWRRSWVWLVMAFAIAVEVIGYAARIVSSQNVTEQTPYSLQFVLIILAPVVMAGIIYLSFGRLILWVVPPEQRSIKLLWAPPRFITPIFVGFDIMALLLQVIGAVLLAGTDRADPDALENLQRGKDLGMAGVTLQIIAFGFFSIVTVRFHFVSRRIDPAYAASNKSQHNLNKDCTALLNVINISCLLILIRSAYREVEFAGGRDSTVAQSEWYLYVFDALPILAVTAAYTFWFPGRFIGNLGFRAPKQSLPKYDTLTVDNSSRNIELV
ncbi:RTA1 like protein-domain-containing protein [Stachybotrys elegans]|uniref:RTA1 like protein-domain-containing protein n=1 Tax=Stachybotrys elegans TaxID=80388 RepID=A0A8K0SLW1_9HYPO|nr:RTA1 like protein-domain-containing protein [Stachybotrys elegans]